MEILYFLIGSALISIIMEAIKLTPGIEDRNLWKNYQQWYPLILGGISGPFLTPFLVEGSGPGWGVVIGAFAGGVSSFSYKLVKSVLAKRAGVDNPENENESETRETRERRRDR